MFNWRSEPIKDNDEKAKTCKDQIEELTDTEKALYQQRFDNISTEYDGILGIKDNRKALIEAYSALAETKGFAANSQYATTIKGIEKERLTSLSNQREAMQNELNEQVKFGEIEIGSETWNQMVADIQAVDIEIINTKTSIAELDNQIRQISWDKFDEARVKISNIINEADYLIKLMDNDDMYDEKTGKLTDEGIATLGMHKVNYELYLSEVEKYATEIKRLETEISKNPHDTALIQRKQELIEKQQESALAAKTEKDALIELTEQGIDAQLNAMKELIDSYTEALDSQKD